MAYAGCAQLDPAGSGWLPKCKRSGDAGGSNRGVLRQGVSSLHPRARFPGAAPHCALAHRPSAPPDPLAQRRVCRVHVGAHAVGHAAVHQLKRVARGPADLRRAGAVHGPASSLQVSLQSPWSSWMRVVAAVGQHQVRAAVAVAGSWEGPASTADAPCWGSPPLQACPQAAAWPCAAPEWRPGRGRTQQTPPGAARSHAAAPRWHPLPCTRAPGLQQRGGAR